MRGITLAQIAHGLERPDFAPNAPYVLAHFMRPALRSLTPGPALRGAGGLVLEILFDQTDVARRLEPIDLPSRRALAAWLVDYYEYDPIILARVVKNEIRRRARRSGESSDGPDLFLEKVREHLYPEAPPSP